MTPHRDARGGTLILDRIFRGVGRIRRASGTNHLPTFRKIEGMLTALKQQGREDVLRAMVGRRGLEPLAVLRAYQTHRLEELPTAETLQLLAATYTAWVATYRNFHPSRNTTAPRDYHLDSLRQTLRHLEKVRPGSALADLAVTLELLRNTLGVEHPRAFVLARSNCLAFIRDTLKTKHPLYADVTAVLPVPTTPTRRKKPQTVAQLTALAAGMSPAVAGCTWSMATTGMGADEYWGRWERRSGSVHIHGTKRAGRERHVPDVGRCTVPAITRRSFEKMFRIAVNGACTPYDLRRSFSRWLEEAGVPRTRRRLYMGHGPRDTTDLYEWHEVQAFLAADAKTLKSYLVKGAAAGRLRLVKR